MIFLKPQGMSSGDVRRSASHALRPVLKGLVTVDQVFDRRLDAEDIDRLRLMLDTLARHGSKELAGVLRNLRDLVERAEGKSLAEIV